MKLKTMLLLVALLPGLAHAGNAASVRKTVEASMQVRGQVVIAPDGALQSFQVHRPEALPKPVLDLVSQYLPGSTFKVETASGRPETVTADMSLHVVATQSGDDGHVISIEGARFKDPATPDFVKSVDLAAPRYPMNAASQRYSGIVYVVLALDGEGNVTQAHVEKVDMTTIAPQRALESARQQFSKVTEQKAREWRFAITPEGLEEGGPYRVRVPVEFSFDRTSREDRYGQWRAYVPGPYRQAPWQQSSGAPGLGAMTAGGIYTDRNPITLLERSPGG